MRCVRCSLAARSVAATAVVYFRRLYAGSSFSQYDPHLVAPGCLYLASKVEESVVAAKLLMASMKRLRPAWQYELKDLLDMEMVRAQHSTHTVLGPAAQAEAQLAPVKQAVSSGPDAGCCCRLRKHAARLTVYCLDYCQQLKLPACYRASAGVQQMKRLAAGPLRQCLHMLHHPRRTVSTSHCAAWGPKRCMATGDFGGA